VIAKESSPQTRCIAFTVSVVLSWRYPNLAACTDDPHAQQARGMEVAMMRVATVFAVALGVLLWAAAAAEAQVDRTWVSDSGLDSKSVDAHRSM